MRLTLISEGAKTLEDIQAEGLFVIFMPDAPSVEDALREPPPKVDFNLVRGQVKGLTTGVRPKFVGGVEIEVPFSADVEPAFDVGVYAVHSDAPHGYGPFLYDLAAEFATMHGMGIMSAAGASQRFKALKGQGYSRGVSSDDAAGLWRGYNKRSDIKRAYGGPGYDADNMHMTSSLRKPPRLLLALSKLGLIVTMRGQTVDFSAGL